MMRTIAICGVAWLVPGAGHVLLRKWWRGLLFFLALLLLSGSGLFLDGQLFSLSPGLFGILKFVADAGVGLFYIVAKSAGWGQGDVTGYSYEYGNTFLFTAGLLNMLVVVDAFDISQGRKQ